MRVNSKFTAGPFDVRARYFDGICCSSPQTRHHGLLQRQSSLEDKEGEPRSCVRVRLSGQVYKYTVFPSIFYISLLLFLEYEYV